MNYTSSAGSTAPFPYWLFMQQNPQSHTFPTFLKHRVGSFAQQKKESRKNRSCAVTFQRPFWKSVNGGELGRSPQTWPVPLEQPACLTAENASNYMFGAVEEGPAAAGNLRLRRGANSV